MKPDEYGREMELSSILVIHGPNLSLLGKRETSVYGSATLEDHVNTVRATAARHAISVESMQSNSEADIVTAVHNASSNHGAIIINAGALTHYSWSLHDALRSFPGFVIEVHLSNPGAREDFRHVSVLAPVVNGTISGFGGLGYSLAVQALVEIATKK